MRTPVKIAIVIGVLVVAVCTVYALHFAMQTDARLVRLESYINGKTVQRNDQFDQQEREIRELQDRLCRLDPTACDD